jgi:hypothetical protein
MTTRRAKGVDVSTNGMDLLLRAIDEVVLYAAGSPQQRQHAFDMSQETNIPKQMALGAAASMLAGTRCSPEDKAVHFSIIAQLAQQERWRDAMLYLHSVVQNN